MSNETGSTSPAPYEATLAAIAERIGSLKSSEIDQGIRDTLADMGKAMKVDTGHVFRVYHSGRFMEHTHAWKGAKAPAELTSIRDTELSVVFPWIDHQLKLHNTVAVDSIGALKKGAPSEHAMFQRLGAKALMFVPMSVGGQLSGFFCFVSFSREVDWDASTIHFVRAVGSIIAETIERHRFEESQRQFEGIIEGSSDFVAVIGSDSRRLHYVNRAGLKMLGLDRANEADLSLLHIDEIIPEPYRGRLLNEVFPRVDKGGSWTGDSMVRSAYGTDIAVSQSVGLLPQGEGSEPCYSTVMRDISTQNKMEEARRRENEFTQALLDGSGALFVVLDLDGRIVRFNPSAAAATGYQSEEVIGRRAWDVFVPREEVKTVKGVFNRLASGDEPSRTESSIIAKDRSRHVISWSNTALKDAAGKVAYIVQSGVDITEAKRLEKEVLDIAEQEQARFGQDLHDGLGQHLAGIEFMSQALEQKLAEDHSEAAERVRDIKDLIRNAITQTRDLARGLSPVVLQSKGLQAALKDLANSVEKQAGLRCVLESDEDIVVTHEEASIHLYRIAQEAVSNAMKHGKATAITISLRNVGQRLELRIEDNGQGFADNFKVGKGMGLRGMNYRAGIIGGSLEIVMRTGTTAIICSVQLSQMARQPDSQTELPEILRE